MPEVTGEVNAYYCETCHGYIVTRLVDNGTTPFMLACRVLGGPDTPEKHLRRHDALAVLP